MSDDTDAESEPVTRDDLESIIDGVVDRTADRVTSDLVDHFAEKLATAEARIDVLEARVETLEDGDDVAGHEGAESGSSADADHNEGSGTDFRRTYQ